MQSKKACRDLCPGRLSLHVTLWKGVPFFATENSKKQQYWKDNSCHCKGMSCDHGYPIAYFINESDRKKIDQ